MFGFTGDSSRLNRIREYAAQRMYIGSNVLGTILVSVSCAYLGGYNWTDWMDLFSYDKPLMWFIIGAISLLIGSIGNYKDNKNLHFENQRLKNIEKERDAFKEKINSVVEDSESLQIKLSDLNYDMVLMWLKIASKNLAVDTHERITIYHYKNDHFYLLARYSKNPIFDEVHSQKFSRSYGVISKAWQHKTCIDLNIPDYNYDKTGYKKHMFDNYQYPKDKIERLTMKSCQYVAIAIDDRGVHKGVIVFESDNLGTITTEKADYIIKYCTENNSYLVGFLDKGIQYDKSAQDVSVQNKNTDADILATLSTRS